MVVWRTYSEQTKTVILGQASYRSDAVEENEVDESQVFRWQADNTAESKLYNDRPEWEGEGGERVAIGFYLVAGFARKDVQAKCRRAPV